MKDFDALKDIWTVQSAKPKLDYDSILKQVKKNKASYTAKLLTETLVMLAIVLLLASVWIFKSFVLWTSHLSLFILISCCLYYLIVQIRDYKSLINNNTYLEQPDRFITYLKEYRKKRYILNTRTFTAYSIFIGIAIGLYFIEVFVAAPLWQTIAAISFTIAWFVLCMVLMQSYKKKEQDKLSEIINNLEKLEKQFGE